MMIIRNLSSEIDMEAMYSKHVMTVGLTEGGSLDIPIDALTYGQLVGAFEQLQLANYNGAGQAPPGPSTVEDVRVMVEQHLQHQVAPGPIPAEEEEAQQALRLLEQSSVAKAESPESLLRSVGFLQEDEEAYLDIYTTGTDSDEQDPGEEDLDDVEAY